MDKSTGVAWTSHPVRPQFGEILLRTGERSALWRIARFDEIEARPDRLRLVCKPQVGGQSAGVTVEFSVADHHGTRGRCWPGHPAGIHLAYKSVSTSQWQVARVRLLDNALTVTEEDEGRVYVPHRLGIERLAAKAFPGSEQWRTYDDLSMAMCGLVKQGSALLVNWDCVDTRLDVKAPGPTARWLPAAGRMALSPGNRIAARRLARSIRWAGATTSRSPKAYRPLAKAKGWRQTVGEKRKSYPTVDRIFGAADFKPFVLSRVVPSSRVQPRQAGARPPGLHLR